MLLLFTCTHWFASDGIEKLLTKRAESVRSVNAVNIVKLRIQISTSVSKAASNKSSYYPLEEGLGSGSAAASPHYIWLLYFDFLLLLSGFSKLL